MRVLYPGRIGILWRKEIWGTRRKTFDAKREPTTHLTTYDTGETRALTTEPSLLPEVS